MEFLLGVLSEFRTCDIAKFSPNCNAAVDLYVSEAESIDNNDGDTNGAEFLEANGGGEWAN